MDLNEKKRRFIGTYEALSDMYTILCEEDKDFDPGSKIASGLGRIQVEVDYMRTDVEKDFDFRDLKIEGCHLEDDVAASYRNVWFVEDSNEDNSIHIFVPNMAIIENMPSYDSKYIVIVDQLKSCQQYKTFVVDAKTWISDSEELGLAQNLKDMSEYINEILD